MSDIVWDWSPYDFSPPFTTFYGKGLADDEDDETVALSVHSKEGMVSVLANAPNMTHQNGKWYVVTMHRVPQDQRRNVAQALKLLVEQRWHDHIIETEQENQS